MRFLVACVHLIILQDGSVVLDPNLKQNSKAVASLIFTFESRTRAVISSHSEGKVSQLKMQECLSMAKTAADKVFQFYRLVIGRTFSKE
jgi:ribonuclease PH